MPDRSSRPRGAGPRSRRRPGRTRAAARARWSAVSVLTVALVLTGCSKDPAASTASTATTATSPAVSPTSLTGQTSQTSATSATGSTALPTSDSDLVEARSGAFGVVPPEAWAEATDRAGDVPGLDLVLLSSRKVAGFGTNLVVITTAGDAAALEAELDRGREQLGAAGRTITETPDKQVAGSTARGFQSAFEQQGVKVVARSYGLTRGGKVYLLTLSSAEQEATHAMSELDEILTSWTWS